MQERRDKGRGRERERLGAGEVERGRSQAVEKDPALYHNLPQGPFSLSHTGDYDP